jgi:hypothetical protein
MHRHLSGLFGDVQGCRAGPECSAPQLATIAFAAVFLGFAAPGIPPGASIMLTSLVIAVDAIAQAIWRRRRW